MEPLFRDVKELSFGKVATFKLPSDISKWVTEILKNFHEKYPWAGKYMTSVELKEKKPEEGYGFGWVEVTSSSDNDATSVKIPLIIKDNELLPMDVIVDRKSNYYPMNPKRLDEALFRPDLFERTVKEEELKGQAETGPFSFEDRYPSPRQGYFGGGVYSGGGEGAGGGSFKTGSLLWDIKNTVLDGDLSKVATQIGNDETLRKHAFGNKAFFTCLQRLQEMEQSPKVASVDYEREIDPTVMQVVRLPRAHYLMKTANPRAYYPVRKKLDRATALAKLGEDLVRRVDGSGSVTITTDTCKVKTAEEQPMQPTKESGIYQVSTITGKPLNGVVFSKIVNFSGDEIPVRVFCSQEGYGMQEEIMGTRTDGLAMNKIPHSTPKGFGLFYWDQEGSIKATEPIFVLGAEMEDGAPSFKAHTMMGEEKEIIPTSVRGATPTEDGLMIPASAKFHALKGDKAIPLVSDEASEEKLSSFKGYDRKVSIKFIGGGKFNFGGRCGIEKLSSVETRHLDYSDALFLATTLGMSPEFASTKLAAAIKHGNTTVTGLYPIIPIAEYEARAEVKLASVKDSLSSFMNSLRQDLIKEAVILEDEDSVDKVLGLNFINPDNIRVFVEYIPELEQVLQKLNKLLLSTRLGMDDLDEAALMNSIAGLEKTISGLKLLLHTLPDQSVPA